MAVSTHPSPRQTTTRLANFLAALFTDWTKLRDFLAEAEDEMGKAGLTEKEQGYLTDLNFRNICDHVWDAGPAPAIPPASGGPP